MTIHELASTRRPIGAGVWIAVCTCGKESAGRRKRKSAVCELDRHIEQKTGQPSPPKCPHPNKQRFREQNTALAHLGQRWKNVRPGQLQAHAYLCMCGYWHLTKKDQT